MLGDHMNMQLKQGVKIITCDTITNTIEAETRNGEVISVNAYHYSPTFRWPQPGEKWIVTEENGSWYLTGIYEQQVAAFENWIEGNHYGIGAIVKYTGHYYEKFEEKEHEDNSEKPIEAASWQLYKLPQVKPGDSVISASSGRILQNNGGKITEVPNGLRVPWFPEVSAGSPKSFSAVANKLAQFAEVINDMRHALFVYNMVEAKDEVNPESRLGTKSGEHLDSVFGAGTGADFARRVDLSDHFSATADVTEYKHPMGFIETRIVWTAPNGNEIAKLRMHMSPDRVHFVSARYREKGFHQTLLGEANSEGRGGLGRWLRTLEIKIMTAQPDNKKAERALAMTGWHWQEYNGQDLFAVRLDQRDRMDEYREWLEAGSDPAQEPEWRKELRLLPKLL